MIRAIICILAVISLQAVVFAGFEADILQTHRVILKSGVWAPSAEETQKALLAVQSFMENPDSTKEYQKREIGKILENTKNYRVQFIGVLHEGKKVIRCNFFPSPRNGEKDEFPRWKQQRVEVKDGGFWFWQIDYDPDTGKCMNFISMDTDRTPIEPI